MRAVGVHQSNESNDGLLVIALIVAALYLAVAALGGLILLRIYRPETLEMAS